MSSELGRDPKSRLWRRLSQAQVQLLTGTGESLHVAGRRLRMQFLVVSCDEHTEVVTPKFLTLSPLVQQSPAEAFGVVVT